MVAVLPLTLAGAAVAAGSGGPLGADPSPAAAPVLAPSLSAELARDGTAVLVVGPATEPVRLTRARPARFGDDDIAPLRTTGARLNRIATALRAGDPGETGAAIADAAALGVAFVVLADREQGQRALAAAGPLGRDAPPTADGRPVLRVVRPSPGAELLGPQLAQQARSGAAPPTEPGVTGVPLPTGLPSLAARVAPGAQGRLLVLAAHDEPGWRATLDGDPVPVIRAWGTQVAVAVPAGATEVRLGRSDVARAALLLAQAAVVLLAVGTAIPTRRRSDD